MTICAMCPNQVTAEFPPHTHFQPICDTCATQYPGQHTVLYNDWLFIQVKIMLRDLMSELRKEYKSKRKPEVLAEYRNLRDVWEELTVS